jgi:glycosyltransferase involved in cell wall biosynthesis
MSSSSNKVLLIAFHYPPIQGSSGFNRVLAFSKYLINSGWIATVLTVTAKTYSEFRQKNYELIPEHISVLRAKAIDGQRDLSFKGKHLKIFSLPDRWQSWIFTGIWKGLLYIHRVKPKVIFSTYPISSAHCIALVLHKITKVPWVADFRDPMAQLTWPPSKFERMIYSWIEKKVFSNASAVIVTTESTRDYYSTKFPLCSHKIELITNGFDEDTFSRLSAECATAPKSDKIILLHSGSISIRDRNPTLFFEAVSILKSEGLICSSNMNIIFRASGSDLVLKQKIVRLGIQDVVELLPPIDYQEAVKEMFSSTALLVFQGETCNRQIPAKIYEYLYVNKPILACLHPDGDTSVLLRSVENSYNANLEDIEQIKSLLLKFINDSKQNTLKSIPSEFISQYSRKNTTLKLAKVLDQVAK